jgi:predicted MFS family arabinose efflux permease
LSPWLRIFLPYAAGYFLSYLLRNANAVIAPELSRELGISASGLGLLTSAYLLAFGAFQLPLGILLDRYGPRRVEAWLLVVAAAGSAAFGLGGTLPQLAVARAAIGLGVSSCLMASFKAFSVWFPAERQPSLNAAVMVAGGLGALAATTPLSLAVPALGWRGVFLALAALFALAAAGVASTPERDPGGSHETFREQLAALGDIVRSRAFRHYAPPTTFFVGGFMAFQGLWAVPFLIQVSGLSREAAAFHLLLTTVAMMGGFLGVAVLIGRLWRRGVHPDRVLGAGMVVQLAALLGLVLGVGSTHLWWFVQGLSFAAGNLAYAVLASQFRPAVAGRANTALNLAVFAGAFLIQWAYGAALDALGAGGWSPAAAHRAATGALVALQAASLAWFARGAAIASRARASGA